MSTIDRDSRDGRDSGHFGPFGGRYVSETLVPALDELEAAYRQANADVSFHAEMNEILRNFVGRPTPLTPAPRLAAHLGDQTGMPPARLFLKREDLCHTGAHKINNCVGQGLLARRMGKRRLIAETGAGQHGVATATVAAHLGMPCDIYMGAEDISRQALNVYRMQLLGARVIPVTSGTQTLKDAMNEALRDWVTNIHDTYYLIGSVAGPHPYPTVVRQFQQIIGQEARAQIQAITGRLPDACVACVGGGSNAMGLFHAFRDDPVELYGVEAAGDGLDTERHAATLSRGRLGVLHGSKSYVLSDADGQILPAHSISAGLDYPGVGPEHAFLRDSGRAIYGSITDTEALSAMTLLGQSEGILPALETAHAIAYLLYLLPELWKRHESPIVIVSLSGRGDKDMGTAARALDLHLPGVAPGDHGEILMTAGTMDRIGNRIDDRFAALRARGEKALIVYLTAFDPNRERSLQLLFDAARGGADLLEIGVPWSDPTADGPVIQRAMLRGLAAGATLSRTLGVIGELRQSVTVPIVLFGYYNPLLCYGPARFAKDAAAAGVDGVLIVDLPPEESAELDVPLRDVGIRRVPLLGPTTSSQRAARIASGPASGGFAYYVALAGVTGAGHLNLHDVAGRIASLRPGINLPLAVGFGVRDGAMAAAVARIPGCDAVVVGSAIVQAAEQGDDVAALVSSLKRAVMAAPG